MISPTSEEWRALGEVLATCGLRIIVCGIITMCIALIIIAFCDMRTIKMVKRFLNN